MNSAKPIQVPPPKHVKFTKDGRAYADLDRLIDSELERVGAVVPSADQQSKQNTDDDAGVESRAGISSGSQDVKPLNSIGYGTPPEPVK